MLIYDLYILFLDFC